MWDKLPRNKEVTSYRVDVLIEATPLNMYGEALETDSRVRLVKTVKTSTVTDVISHCETMLDNWESA